MKFATRYSPPESPSVDFFEPSMTDRSFKAECDINTIVSRCLTTGLMPQVEGGLYGDFADLPDNLQDSYALIHDAQERFMQLPANVRADFGNDPLAVISFLQDPSNRQKAIEYGFIDKPPLETSSAPSTPIVSSQETDVAPTPPSEGKS